MADTQRAPTDAEIKDLYAQETGFVLDDSPAALLDFARAVLDKWGQSAHNGEPVAKLVQAAQAFVLDPTSPQKKLHLEAQAWGPLAGTSQPVERKPLPDSWIRSMCAQPWVFDTVKQWVRITEDAHGIKGDEHDEQ